jgi:hypothetical protein
MGNLNLNLDYILSHFQEPIFPRTISTKTIQNRQLVVYSREDALARYAQANWLDCRISAYPCNALENPSAIERFQGLTRATPKNMVVIIDLDKSTFKSERAINVALLRALNNIETTLSVKPTVIGSGNGYHIYVVLDCRANLENVKEFSDLKVDKISLKFLRFIEWFLSCGKSDPAHNSTVTFNNCMLRIPGSINSKNNSEVKLIQRRDNMRPAINYLLADFCSYLANEEAQKLLAIVKPQGKVKTKIKKFTTMNKIDAYSLNPSFIGWIEQLLKTPIPDHRKFVVWMILPQYLVNVRKMSYEQAINVINCWLDQCNKLKRLDYGVRQKLNEGFNSAQKGFRPISQEKLKYWKPELAALLLSN